MADSTLLTRQFRLTGTVQGVGFRPFVARLANRLGLVGWVRNDTAGVTICVRGTATALARFSTGLSRETPPAAVVSTITEESASPLEGPALEAFEIVASEGGAAPVAAVTPDLALCPECRRELFDPGNRRYRYPFINCTNCGPRYSIVRELPYDRPHTTMAGFTMCPTCLAEYADPLDRRYHAQPNACPECGPQLSLLDADGSPVGERNVALAQAVEALRRGEIVAVKGLGGFHLCVDAFSAAAIAELRQRKHREEKPLAVMVSSIEALRFEAEVSLEESAALRSVAAPIVLVRRQARSRLPAELAPGNPWVGAMLPYTPLHTLLLADFGRPIVATSANLSEEPLCTDNAEAVARLQGIADRFLVHDRPIARAIDDSVVRFGENGRLLLRRARGFAPTPLPLPEPGPASAPLLCVGGHLKNTVGVTAGSNLVLSPHLGDLENPLAQGAFERTIGLLTALYGGRESRIACDTHPEYASTLWAEQRGLPLERVQHHVAHVLACLLEHPHAPTPVLGVAWDGTGYGDDGTIWGGEWFRLDREARTVGRVASLRPFLLPGGEAAVRDTRRSLLGLWSAAGEAPEVWLDKARRLGFRTNEAVLLHQALERRLNCPETSSAGRLFDGVAALLGLCPRNTFEAQGGMAVEAAAARWQGYEADIPDLPVVLDHAEKPWRIYWAPMLAALARLDASAELRALAFHHWCADAVAAVATRVGCPAVALSGGCFQNALLTDLVSERLEAAGFAVLRHRDLSPNDNSIAAGQAVWVTGGWRREGLASA